VAIFPAQFAVTFGSICSGPLDLVHRTLFGSTFGSVGTGLWVSKAGLLRMPYLSTESAGPAPFSYFPPFRAKPFLLGCIQGFHLLNYLMLIMCLLDLVVLDDVGLVEEYGDGHHACNARRVCALVVKSIRKFFQKQSISISWESLHEIDYEHGLIEIHFWNFLTRRLTGLLERICFPLRMLSSCFLSVLTRGSRRMY